MQVQEKQLVFAIDYDGTCVKHEFPDSGEEIGAADVLRKIVAKGHLLVLNTMRSGKYLADPISWFSKHGLPLHGVNVNPDQLEWTTSPKVFAHVSIDDTNLGIPLLTAGAARPYVDWAGVEQLLIKQGIL